MNFKDIPKIDCEYLIYFNLLQAGERSGDIKAFRRHIQYALYLISGKIKDDSWIKEAQVKAAELLKTMDINKDNEDYEFLLYCSLSMKVIEKMSDEEIVANVEALYRGIVNALPKKVENVKNVMVKLTMTKPIKVEIK
jgi:hypothetical protein